MLLSFDYNAMDSFRLGFHTSSIAHLGSQGEEQGQGSSFRQEAREEGPDSKREHQSMTWLCTEVDNRDRSLVSTLWCVVCRQYETRICGLKNFSTAWIDGLCNYKTSRCY